MFKKFVLFVAGIAISLGASAAPITPQQALDRLNSNGPVKARSTMNSGLELAYTANTPAGNPSAYLFIPQDQKGYVILAADDSAQPILGYSGTAQLDVNNLPAAFTWWISEYGRHIEYLNQNGGSQNSAPMFMSDREPIQPLLKTKWGQDAPYNGMAPMIGNVQCPTGCAATSFAQVMNYFKYPEKGSGYLKYTSNGTTYVLNLEKTPFDWDNMLDVYTKGSYNDTQADAVAYLMKACGYSIEMMYGTSASGAQSYKIGKALIDNFDYDPGVIYADRNNYSYDLWFDMVYNNLKNVGPIIYNGTSIDGGHSFVCDGYDGEGYFHINWGWDGLSDGYFLLDALNPDAQGTGGSAAEGGFNFSQDAYFGIQPKKETATPSYGNLTVYGSLSPSLDGSNLKIAAVNNGYGSTGWVNANFKALNCGFGTLIQKSDGTGSMIEVDASINGNTESNLDIYYYINAVYRYSIQIPSSLADGEYKVYPACKDLDVEGAPYQPLITRNGIANYILLTVNNGSYSVAAVADAKLTFDSATFESPLYYDRNALLNIKVTNNTDTQLTRCIYPALADDNAIQYKADYQLITVDPGQTIEKKAVIRFLAVDGATNLQADSYTLYLYDADSNQVFLNGGPCSLESTSGGYTLTLNDFSVEGDFQQQDVTIGSRTFKNVYIIDSPQDFDLLLNYTVKLGYFDSSMHILGAPFVVENNAFATADDWYKDTPFLGTGDSKEVHLSIDYDSLNKDVVYMVRAAYIQTGRYQPFGTLYFGFPEGAGVNDILVDETLETPVYYSLQGLRLDAPVKGQVVIRKIGDKIEKIIF
ncbi:MAG: C10 family peptidase [Lepagella sp.]